MKKIHRLAPCAHYDVERIESWLTDMASQGFHLMKEPVFMGFFAFEKGTGAEVRYRLEPKQKLSDGEKPDMEQRAMFRDYGWEFVTDYGMFYIYRALSPEAAELNTDPQVQAVSMKGAMKQLILPLLIVIHVFCNAITDIFTQPVRHLLNFGIVYTAGYFLVMAGAMCMTLVRLNHFFRLRRKLKKNIPLDHRKPWRKTAFLNRFLKAAEWIFYFLIFGVILAQCTNSMTGNLRLSDYSEDPPFITIGDLCPEGDYTLHNGDTYNTVVVDESFLAPLYMEWHEEGEVVTPEGGTIGGTLKIIYYETKYPWLAERLPEEFCRQGRELHDFRLIEAPAVDVDCVIAYTFLNGRSSTILMRHGNVFVEAYINVYDEAGQNMAEQWAARMAAVMTAG